MNSTILLSYIYLSEYVWAEIWDTGVTLVKKYHRIGVDYHHSNMGVIKKKENFAPSSSHLAGRLVALL